MSHVNDLYMQEAMGIISSREFDRRFDDAVEADMIDAATCRDPSAEYEAYCHQASQEYYEGMLAAMPPHDRKHALHPARIYLKGWHTHNHVWNCIARHSTPRRY